VGSVGTLPRMGRATGMNQWARDIGAEAVDHISIRGRMLPLDGLLHADIEDPELIADQRRLFATNQPFEHIVMDGLFDDRLLDLLLDEFGDEGGWRKVESHRETTYRSTSAKRLGAATQTYMNLVYSAAFVGYLSAITGLDNLITDSMLMGGGLHETKAGGRFGVHRDFNYHKHTMLSNALVLITYLNHDWEESYGGALELWDEKKSACVSSVLPLFGRTILFRHSERSYHGHPHPLTPPPGRTRRSITAYYYLNQHTDMIRPFWRSSSFLEDQQTTKHKAKMLARGLVPPLVWQGIKHLRFRKQARDNY
jgi:Rps23 Pro-64 3,4-dihydroxylase Tpa1-like proline 4-hydroxylase